MIQFPSPIIGLCAYSGTGKTTLLTQLIPLLAKRNFRVGVIKHAHHKFDIDHPGKDSYELRQAGAHQVAVASRKRIAWIKEYEGNKDEPVLTDALSALDADSLDLVIVEGFKQESFPKIELHRSVLGKPLLCQHDKSIIALASDEHIVTASGVRLLDLNNAHEIADFIVNYTRSHGNKTPAHAEQT